MTEKTPLQARLQARVVWADLDDLPVFAASHFALQTAVHEAPNFNDLILTVGYLLPPFLQGTEAEQQEAAASVADVTIRPIARFSLPVSKATELAALLTSMSEQLLQARGQEQ